MSATADLECVPTAALLEDFARHRRYEDRLRKSLGHAAYEVRFTQLAALLRERGVVGFTDPIAVPPRPSCRLQPLSDHVVVLPTEAETISDGGIVIPDTAKEKPRTGEVLAVGPGRIEPNIGTVVPNVSVGDQVLFGIYSGISFSLDGLDVLIMREEDVLGVLQPKASEE